MDPATLQEKEQSESRYVNENYTRKLNLKMKRVKTEENKVQNLV